MNALFWKISGAAPHVQFASCTFKLHKVDVDAKGEKFSMPLALEVVQMQRWAARSNPSLNRG